MLRKAMDSYRRFLYGRYGQDGLNRFISVLALVFCVLSFFIRSNIVYICIFALFALSLFRSLSKKHAARRRENQAYEKAARPAKRFFKYWFVRIKSQKTHRVYRCDQCSSILRIPKSAGGGKFEIKCPKCGQTSTRRLGGSG